MGLLIRTKFEAVWNCFLFLESRCSDIPEGKDMGDLLQRLSVTGPCTCCTAAMEDMDNGNCDDM